MLIAEKLRTGTLPVFFAHTVTQTDEKLSDIAEWYTGSASNQKAIATANPDIDHDLLLVGNEIYIPSHLLITDKPLSPKSVQKTAKVTGKGKQPEAAPAAPGPKKIQLFGPKPFQAN